MSCWMLICIFLHVLLNVDLYLFTCLAECWSVPFYMSCWILICTFLHVLLNVDLYLLTCLAECWSVSSYMSCWMWTFDLCLVTFLAECWPYLLTCFCWLLTYVSLHVLLNVNGYFRTPVQLHRVHAAGYQERPLPGHQAESNVSEGNVCAVVGLLLLSTSNNNSILYSSLREIKAVVRSHNEEHNNSKSLNTCTYTLLDICPLSLNLHTLIANPKFPGIMLSLSNQNVKTLKLNKNH